MIKLGLYQHYKGKMYHVLGVARYSESPHKLLVIYQALYDGYNVWVRPFDMFTGTVAIDGKEKPRFKFLKETVTEAATIEKR
ncbi:DUF1653 domain-containing protein [Candidatus Babeliales bacterium]|nr:DUF1653 domain-containing protein [Candidatus Babeliales bacterium]